MSLDINRNRASTKWSLGEQLLRIIWGIASPLFRCSPRVFWAWRVWILRGFGASIGSNVHIYPSVTVMMPWNLTIGDDVGLGDRVILYNLGRISIGSKATISQGAHLCAGSHDHRRADFQLLKKPILVGEGSWICADAFIGPGVNIGDYAIVGARTVAMRDVDAWTIVKGNPATIAGPRPRPLQT